ncbi:MAG: hypothetical protein IKH07_00860 [Oscillospiraceae bacterium]|nr:hypothetical protein [Oscillospiraceae bacterium]
MRSLSYRSRTRLKKGLKLVLAGLGALLLLVLLFAVFLGRYVVYTPEGARLDFKRNTARDVELPDAQPTPSSPIESLEIEFADPGERNRETTAVSGVYIDLEMLQDPEAVLEAVKELSAPCTVLMDLKGGNGSFYYSTGIDGAQQAAIDIGTVDAVISYLRSHGFTMVARIKTFQDSNFALNHIVSSLRTASGALWVGNGFYWLDPASDTVVAYLKQIARELAEKGFKEIVFDDFRFPNGTQIVYTSDKNRSDLIAGVATDLLNFFASSNITISFGNPNADFALTGASHVYLSGVTGSGVSAAVKGYSRLSDLQNQLVFLTGSKDRRFDDYQVLRPLLSKVVQ